MEFRPKIFIILIFLYPLSFSNILFDKITEKKYKDLIKSIYGENKEITSDYDITLSITCNNGIFVGKKKMMLFHLKAFHLLNLQLVN